MTASTSTSANDSNHTTAYDSTRPPYDHVLVAITEYVFHYDVSNPKALEWARIALFDSLGCVFETLKGSQEARALIGPVVPGAVLPDGFRLPGTSFQLDPVKGAFDLGTLIRYLDHNDAFPGAEWGHPSGKSIPVSIPFYRRLRLGCRQHWSNSRSSRLAQSQRLLFQLATSDREVSPHRYRHGLRDPRLFPNPQCNQ